MHDMERRFGTVSPAMGVENNYWDFRFGKIHAGY